MIPSQPVFIPLYFEQEDDLWLALQQIEPEKRSAFIKDTLRQVLLNTPEKTPTEPFAKFSSDVITSDNDQEIEFVEANDSVQTRFEDFSLESLFTESSSESQTDLNTKTNQSISGVEYLMKQIIGTEDDEKVLEILRQESKFNKS